MFTFHNVPFFCLCLTHYDILIEDLVLGKGHSRDSDDLLQKPDVIQGYFVYFFCYLSPISCERALTTQAR